MALSLTSHLSLLSPRQNPKTLHHHHHQTPNLSFHVSKISKNPRFSSTRINSKPSEFQNSDDNPIDNVVEDVGNVVENVENVVEDVGNAVEDLVWGKEAKPKRKPKPDSSYTKLADSDPTRYEDEWAGGEEDKGISVSDNGTAAAAEAPSAAVVNDELKRCLVDTFYGTELGFRASAEVRGEVLELVNQLESLNPTKAPTEASSLLDGNWVLLYTAFSELVPLLAASNIPLLKVKKICQYINTATLTIDNSTTLLSPFASVSFSASATFEVRSPSRIQVTFKEGSIQPPEISSTLSLPQNIDIFGQKIDLSPLQTSLNPLQDVVANISRVISGQPPLKVRIPGERSSSWLLITYLDEDFRIARGDGGLFILAKEGSTFIEQ